jgi:tetratricopeptide (TPR) repeat protein
MQTHKTDATDLDTMFEKATAAHRSGNLEEAERIYADVLRARPDHFDAVYRLGIIAAQTRRIERAVELFRRAIALNKNIAGVHRNLGHALMELRRPKDALASYKRAIALDQNASESHFGRGLALYELKRLEVSIECYNKAIEINAGFAEAYYHRALVLRDLKRFQESLVSFDRVIALKPDFADAYINRGNVLCDLYRLEEALASLDQAIALRPDYAEAYSNRGNVLRALRRFDEALASSDKAIALKPGSARVHINRGNVLYELNRVDEALASFDKAIALDPSVADSYNNRGRVLIELGQSQEAYAAHLEALRLDPKSITAYFYLAGSKTFSAGDPHLAAMESLARSEQALSNDDCTKLDFTLGKAYADLKDYRRSFTHLRAGNARKRATINYDEKSVFDFFDRIESVFTRDLIVAKASGGYPSSSLPVFVLGMPRSGTTLVEQIIASHPMVHGAGELHMLQEIVHSVRGPAGDMVSYPELALTLDASGLRQVGERYVDRLHELAPGAERITDKMPANWYLVGLIHLTLPNAKILHVVRDPIDTCLSCFSNLFFSDTQNQTYDLGEIGRYYKRYQRLMAHWRCILPSECFLDVQYENVVADLESEARRILAYCGLPWDHRCLAFHKSKRLVRTASAEQIRQPIYKSAVGRWRVYEEFLGPLLTEFDAATRAET